MGALTPPCVGLSSQSAFARSTCSARCSRSLTYWGSGPVSGTGECLWALAKKQEDIPRIAEDPLSGRRSIVEKRWREFFSDPSQWWDNRAEKWAQLQGITVGAIKMAEDVTGGKHLPGEELDKKCREKPVMKIPTKKSEDPVKVNPRYPDFKHIKTEESLWCLDKFNPSWVEAELAAMGSGTVQLSRFTWNKRLTRYAKAGHHKKTMELFRQMLKEGLHPNSHSFVAVLNSCSSVRALEEGRDIHRQAIKSGCESDVFVGSCLVDMYAKCGSIEDAVRVFNKMPTRNVVSWNAMILGFVKCGQGRKALEVSQQMQWEGIQPDTITFVGMLNACASVAALEEGRDVHRQIIQRGLEFDVFVGSSLLDMYGKCGSIEDALRLFTKMPTRNLVSWNAMILGHVKCGQGRKALELSQQMQREGVEPDTLTFVAMLNACASITALEEGRHVHAQIIQKGLEADVFVCNSLIDMYAKCASVEDAWSVFNKMPKYNVVSWSSMIHGYVKCSQGLKALELYRRMQEEGVELDPVTIVGVLSACVSVADLEEGRRVHEHIIQNVFESDVFVCNSLVDMYAKCGSVEDAWAVFKKMPIRNVVSWSAMILGYVKCRQGHKALELCRQMQQERVEPDPVTFVGMLNACASVAALQEGKHVHEQIIQRGLESNVFLGNSLIDMYAKCGSIEDAWRVFNEMPTRNVVSWSAMIGGCALHGNGKEALELFKRMCQEGVEINCVTFVSLLSACSHAGLVDEGLHYFEAMSPVYSISPTVEHYACMVDLLGRAGRLHEAEQLIKTMTCKPNAPVWTALLGACRVHSNVKMGERIAERVLELEPESSAGYVLLSNIYAATGEWDRSANIQREMVKRGVKKFPGRTWIEVNNEVHSFVVNDQEHPQLIEIYEELDRLSGEMKEAGYVPDLSFALHDVDDESKEVHLCHHSEKLAIAFGLISTPPHTPLHILKNLRVCGDCHTAIKVITKILGRTIIIRDANRFHRVQHGVCSCKDYW